MGTTRTDPGEFDRVPLCRQYLLAAICDVPLTRPDAGTTVRWGLGALASGNLEMLGVWPTHGADNSAWQAICADLRRRGVEVIQYVAGSNSDGFNAALSSTFSHATVLRDDWHQSKEASVRRNTRVLRSANDAVHELRRRINQAVARHGSFQSSAAAASFLSAKLVALEPRVIAFETAARRTIDVRARRPWHF